MALQRPAAVLRVYVGGIGVGVTEQDLYAAFAGVDVPLSHVELVVNRATGCLRGFAFVTIADEPKSAFASANIESLLAQMRLAHVGDRPFVVQAVARDLTPRSVHGPTGAEQDAVDSQRDQASQRLAAAGGPLYRLA